MKFEIHLTGAEREEVAAALRREGRIFVREMNKVVIPDLSLIHDLEQKVFLMERVAALIEPRKGRKRGVKTPW